MDQKSRGLLIFYAKKYLNWLGLGLTGVMMVPTVAILLTWNTLPGEKLYPVKSYLEEVALKLVGDNFSLRTELQTQFVSQRFSESQTLLAQSSGEGLESLALQIQATKREILEAKQRGNEKEVVVAQKKAEEFVTQLKDYQQQLEVSKVELIQTNTPIATPEPQPKSESKPTSEATPTPLPTKNESANDANNVNSETGVVVAVEQVQDEIENTIIELEEVTQAVPQNIDQLDENRESKKEIKSRERQKRNKRKESKKEEREKDKNRFDD